METMLSVRLPLLPRRARDPPNGVTLPLLSTLCDRHGHGDGAVVVQNKLNGRCRLNVFTLQGDAPFRHRTENCISRAGRDKNASRVDHAAACTLTSSNSLNRHCVQGRGNAFLSFAIQGKSRKVDGETGRTFRVNMNAKRQTRGGREVAYRRRKSIF